MDRRWPETARWTENDVSGKSGSNRERMDFSVLRAISYLMDRQKKERLEQLQCAYCFYDGPSLVGQAFTEWNCRVCLKDQQMWPNTGTPLICNPCAKQYKLCHECGADLYLRVRRNNVQPLPEKTDG